MTNARGVPYVLRALILSRKNGCIHPKPPPNHLSLITSHLSLHRSLTPSPSPKERGITPREAILWFLKFRTYQKNPSKKNSWHWLRGSPLLWRGASGEADGVNIFPVNIPNDNTKNINTIHRIPTIEIVGFNMTHLQPSPQKLT